MTSPYFTHLHVGELSVEATAGSLTLQVNTEEPFRFIAKTIYDKPLYTSDVFTTDDLIELNSVQESVYQLAESVPVLSTANWDDFETWEDSQVWLEQELFYNPSDCDYQTLLALWNDDQDWNDSGIWSEYLTNEAARAFPTELIEIPIAPQFSTERVVLTADFIGFVDYQQRVSDDSETQVFRSTKELAHVDGVFTLTPFMPQGLTSISFYQCGQLVSEVFNRGVPSKHLGEKTTSPETLAYGFLYALAEEDYSLLSSQILSVIEIAKHLNLIQEVNGQYETGSQLGFSKEFRRYDLSVIDNEVSVHYNSLLAFSIVRTVKYFRNRGPLAGVDITVYKQLKAILLNIAKFIESATDQVSNWVYDPMPSYYSTLWASIALGEILSVVYNREIHTTAAHLFLALNSNPPVDSSSKSLTSAIRYLWGTLYNQNTAEDILYHQTHNVCDRESQFWWAALLKEETLEPGTMHEEALALWANSELNLVSEQTFYLYAYEAQAFTTYLYQWAVYMWPTGRMWLAESAVSSGVLNALFKSFSAVGFSYALELFMLQDSHRVGRMQATYLESYSPKPTMMSDFYWSQWLARELRITDLSQKFNHWGLLNFGFYSVSEEPVTADQLDQGTNDLISIDNYVTLTHANEIYKHVNIWDYSIPYDSFDFNFKVTPKLFNPQQPSDLDDLFYQELTRPVLNEGELVESYLRPTPGFSYSIDTSSDFTINTPLEITADSPFAILPLSNLTAQVKVNCPALTGLPRNLLPLGIYLNLHTYQTALTS